MTLAFTDRTVAPEVHTIPVLRLPGHDTYDLECGIRMHVLRSAVCDAPVFSMQLVAAGCGSNECSDRAAASLYPPMLTKGSEGFTADDISELMEGAGAWLSASQQSRHLQVTLRGLTDTAQAIIPALARILAHPLFPADRLSVAARTAAMNRSISMMKPATMAADAVREMLWGTGHPSASVPSPDDLLAVTPGDIARCHEPYNPSHISIYLSGAVTPGLERIVADAFNTIYPAAKHEEWSPVITPAAPTPGRRFLNVPDSSQAAICLRIPTIMRSHPDYEMLHLAVRALGGYFGSRLNMKLREERGLTYGASAALIGSLEGAAMSVTTECRGEAADEALDIITSEIDRFGNEPPEGDELERLRSHALSSLAANLDSPFSMLDYAVLNETIGTPADYFDRMRDAILSSTPDSLSRTFALHINPAASIIAVAR